MSHLCTNTIQQLRTLGEQTGQDLLSQLVKMYLETTPSMISNMKKHLSNSELIDLKREAHSLKSSSLNLGAVQAAEVAKDIEYYLHEQEKPDSEKMNTMLMKLEEMFLSIQPHLEQLAEGA